MKIYSNGEMNKISVKNEIRKQEKVGKTSFADVLSSAIKTSGAESTEKVADTISISATPSNDEFAEKLSAKLSSEVKQGHSAAELAELRNRIAMGTYEIDAKEIAKKILG